MTKNESKLPQSPQMLISLKLAYLLNSPAFDETAQNELITEIALEMLDSEEYLEIFESVISLNSLTNAQITRIAEICEICPIHRIALDICIDDEIAECAHFHS